MQLPWTFSTFDYPQLCELLFEQCDAEFETAKVEGAGPDDEAVRRTDRGDLRAPLVVDAWAGAGSSAHGGYQPPERRCPAGSRSTRGRRRRPRDLDRPRLRPGRLQLELPRRDEVRVGVGSFDPRFHVKEPRSGWRGDLERDAVRYQGNWIPHSSAPRPRTGSSSSATRPGTACR